MNIHSNFALPARVHSQRENWSTSPVAGVDRKMLDRIGEEVARATTIVKFAPNSQFPMHTHDGGEEFLVLEGVFQDEHGDYPAGTYVRNPPGTHHKPGSDMGCTIFVKLWQFDPNDAYQFSIDTNKQTFQPKSNGVSELLLYKDSREYVRIEKWDAATVVNMPNHSGIEVLVLEGQYLFQGEIYEKHAWLRLPPNYKFTALSGELGARVWIKSDHLAVAKNR